MTRLLATTEYGDAGGVPLLIVHGLFGSGRNWRALAKHFSRKRRVITVDLRNHGASFWDDSNTYADMAGDLADVVATYGGQADMLGHSMGGKAAMVLALSRPGLLRHLIVADIAPVAYPHSQLENIKAMQAVPLAHITRRAEAEAHLAPLITEPAVRAFLLSSLVLSPSGNRWSLNLQALADNMPDIMGFPDLSETFGGPTAFVRGGLSDYILPEHNTEIDRLFPYSTLHDIAGAGHWVHAEKPREFMSLVEQLLSGQNL